MRITDEFIIFSEGEFSNSYPCTIKYEYKPYYFTWKWFFRKLNPFKSRSEKKPFFSSEHLFLHMKAIYFRDTRTANRIRKASTIEEAKCLENKIRKFNEDEWNEVRLRYMCAALHQKFIQNIELAKMLVDEKLWGKSFVETSTLDPIWGIGRHYDDPLCDIHLFWQGQNLFGKALDKVRAFFLDENVTFESEYMPYYCPLCGRSRVVPIYYGYLGGDAKKEVEAGEAVSGGCCVYESNPSWCCRHCSIRIYDSSSESE